MCSLAGRVFIRAKSVLTPQGFLDGATVEVEGCLITAIWPQGGARPGAGDEVWDLSDQVLLPGLVNAHSHSAMTLLRGVADDVPLMPWLERHIWPREALIDEEDVYWGTKLAMLEMLASGTTTFCDMYIHMDGVARAVRETGMRAVLAHGVIGRGHDGLRSLEEGVELFYRSHGDADGRITVAIGPHAPYSTDLDVLEHAAQAAQDLGTLVHIHLSETRGEVEACVAEHGVTPMGLLTRTGLEAVRVLAAHAVHLSDEDIRTLHEHNVSVAHCPITNMKLSEGMAPVGRLQAEHVQVGIGSDGAASANTLDLFQSMKASVWGCRLATGDPTKPTLRNVMHMATDDAARAVGLGEVTGRIQPGLRADLIGVSLDDADTDPLYDPFSSLVLTATGHAVRTTIVDGRVLYRDGTFTTIDRGETLAEVKRRSGKLVMA